MSALQITVRATRVQQCSTLRGCAPTILGHRLGTLVAVRQSRGCLVGTKRHSAVNVSLRYEWVIVSRCWTRWPYHMCRPLRRPTAPLSNPLHIPQFECMCRCQGVPGGQRGRRHQCGHCHHLQHRNRDRQQHTCGGE